MLIKTFDYLNHNTQNTPCAVDAILSHESFDKPSTHRASSIMENQNEI